MDTLTAYTRALQLEQRAPLTIQHYRRRVRGWLASGLSPAEYIAAAPGRPEARMRRNALATLATLGLLPAPYKDEPDTFRMPKLGKARPAVLPYISPGEARQFFEVVAEREAGNLRDLCAVKLFYATGARQQELLRATKADLYDAGQGRVIRLMGKGMYPREVPLPAYAIHVLQRYDRWQRPADAEHLRGRDYILLSERGAMIDERPVQALVHRCCDAMGLPRAQHPIHMLRSWYATHMIERECPIEVLMTLMGHASIRQTQEYIIKNPARGRDAVTKHPCNDWVSGESAAKEAV